MKRNLLHFACIALFVCAVFTSCKKTEVAAAATDPQLSFAVLTDNSAFTFPASGTSTNKATFVWTAGTANITQFRLDAKRGGVASTYTTGALSGVDLFSLSQTFSNTSIPKGDYTEAKATIVYTQTTGAPYPLTLNGTFTTAAGVVVPAEFNFNDNLEVKLTLSNIIADGTKNFNTNISMHLNMFLNGISAQDLDAATRVNGVILINKTTNTTLYSKMKANLGICAVPTLSSTAK